MPTEIANPSAAKVSLVRSPAETSASASVTKALRLLDVFESHGPVLGVTEIARRTGVAKSTAFRLLGHLEEAGLVEREGRSYRLSWRLFELGMSVQRRWPQGLRETAAPWLSEVFVRAGGNSVHLAVLADADALFIDKLSGPGSPRVDTSVGSRLPATCTAVGKAILACSASDVVKEAVEARLVRRTAYSITEQRRLLLELRRTQENLVAFDREESALGVTCVAAPIMTGTTVTAALSVSGSMSRSELEANAALVRRAAQRIGLELQRVDVAG